MAASVGKSRRRSATERSRGLRASERGFAAVNQSSRGCERRQIARRRTEEQRAEAFFLCERRRLATDSTARLRERQAQKNCVGPSKYELQGPTV